jgi:ABC-type sugar transport system ATPase subunit
VSEPVLQLKDVTKTYGRVAALTGVDLKVNPGDFYVVTGPPGSGKSVLLRLILGLEKPDTGEIRLHGQDVTNLGAQKRGIGYVPQSFALFPNKTVRENIIYPMQLDKVDKSQMQEVLERVSNLLAISELLEKRPDQLSGGQKQRVAIARGLGRQTDFFVLDDPLIGLDFKLRERLIDDLKRTQEVLNVTFLYSTSDSLESLLLASRVGVISSGRVVDEGPLARVYDEPEQVGAMQSLGFPEANIVDGQINDGLVSCGLGDFKVESKQKKGAVRIGLRPEHVNLGKGAPGSIGSKAKILFTEDVGGSEILYLEVNGTPISTVLGADDAQLQGVRQGEVTINITPKSILLFDTTTQARIGQGV